MKNIERCEVCIYPVTRPDTHFRLGVCSACLSYAQRATIDWHARRETLKQVIAQARAVGAAYDAVVPVSGGKDSTYQVLTLKEMGARILCVAAATDYQSAIGRRNLDNLKRYADVIEVTPQIETRKKLIRIGLRLIGDLSYPEHLAIWAIPTRIADQMGVPLVIWGEQPQREYATPADIEPSAELNADWVAQFGGLSGLRIDDLIGMDGLTQDDLSIYRFPESTTTKGIWLGDYIDWDGWKNALIAQCYGFEVMPHPVEGAGAHYENLDNYVTVLRDYMRYLKFGYTRATDILCSHVRRGRLTRAEALQLESLSMTQPETSLGLSIDAVLNYIGITRTEWDEQCMVWQNHDLW